MFEVPTVTFNTLQHTPGYTPMNVCGFFQWDVPNSCFDVVFQLIQRSRLWTVNNALQSVPQEKIERR